MHVAYFDAHPDSILFALTFGTQGPLAASVPEVIFSGTFWMGDSSSYPTVTLESPTQINGTTEYLGGITFETRFFGTGLQVDSAGNLIAGTITGIQVFDEYSMVAEISQIGWDAQDFETAIEFQRQASSNYLLNQIIFADPVTIDASQSSAIIHGSMYGISTSVDFTGSLGSDRLIGGSGNDTIYGNNGNDYIRGEGGDDLIFGGAGDDNIWMGIGDGADTIDGGAGTSDTLWYFYSGYGVVVDLRDSSRNALFAAGHVITGIENVVGTDGNDELYGDSNNNFLQGLVGVDLLYGNDGDDTLAGAAVYSGTEFHGGNGNDVFYVDQSSGVLFNGGAGWDTADFSRANVYTYGLDVDMETPTTGPGITFSGIEFVSIESVIGTYLADIIRGDGFANRIIGDHGDDTLEGRAGNDIIRGGGGNDSILGGLNEDRLYGEAGDDTIRGNAGHDVLEGHSGADLLDGGDNADNLLGGLGNDTLLGGNGFDRLFGQEDDDLGYGGNGTDALYGQQGDDTLYGQNGNDRFYGGTGNDFLDGGADDDALIGGSGFDTLLGSTGNDTMTGAFNADTFVFADFGGGFGNDVITDFDANNHFERIDLSRVSRIFDLTDLVDNHMFQSGSNIVIDDGNGNTITLQNVLLADLLDGSDFIF